MRLHMHFGFCFFDFYEFRPQGNSSGNLCSKESIFYFGGWPCLYFPFIVNSGDHFETMLYQKFRNQIDTFKKFMTKLKYVVNNIN